MSLRKSEQVNPNSERLHEMNALEIVKVINDADKGVALAVEKALPQIAAMVDKIVETVDNGGRIIYLGAGASGDIAVDDANEMVATFGVDFEVWRSCHAQLGPNYNWRAAESPVLKGRMGSEDNEEQLILDLKSLNYTSKDMVIGISVSGTTGSVMAAMKWAQAQGGFAGAIAMNENSPMGQLADMEIVAVTGPEVLAGSSRMKGGTATKLILNSLSLAANVLAGHVYKGMMVDVSIPEDGNVKLVERSARIISNLTGLDMDAAHKLHVAADENIKVAVVSNNKNVSLDEARKLLAENGDNLQRILG